jgi:hypothetical protein
METVKLDYAPKGVQFFYIYKPLAHPEYQNYVSPINIQERLMHVTEAKRRLGSSITWLADSMDNVYHNASGQTPNSELVVNPDGIIEVSRSWSDPEALREDLKRLVGDVDNETQISDLDMPTQPMISTVAKGVVPRVVKTEQFMPMLSKPIQETSRVPFYTKLRVEGTDELFTTGKGTMYVGFHLDPLYRVHWNNEAPPMQFEITAPDGVSITPSKVIGPDPEADADADPREFLLTVDAADAGKTVDLQVKYFACDDALTFCVPVTQDYTVTLARDSSHGGSIQTSADGSIVSGGNRNRAMGAGMGAGMGARPGGAPPD